MPPVRRQTLSQWMILAGVLSLASAAVADSNDPSVWLDRMSAAVKTSSYEGTVVRVRNGEAEALKVVHTVADGVIREKVVAQEGSGLEIIRTLNELDIAVDGLGTEAAAVAQFGFE